MSARPSTRSRRAGARPDPFYAEARRRLDARGRPTAAALAEERELRREFAGYRGADAGYLHAGRAALDRWLDWKFGLRIHWSLYSITGNGPESWPLAWGDTANPVFREQYERLAGWWNPTGFDVDAWCRMMTRAGIRFFTFTTKHHDGFSMYDTRTRVVRRRVHTGPDAGKIVPCNLAYSIMEGPFRRDVVRELVDAGRRHGLGISLYYSHIDWFDSDFRIDQWNYQRDVRYTRRSDPAGFRRMLARHRAQIVELLTRYGPVDQLSLDMSFPAAELGIRKDLLDTIRLARRLQPHLLIRNRGIGPYGDYTTPERTVPQLHHKIPGPADGLPWKVIYPGSRHFSHVWGDAYQSADWILGNLVDTIAKGGNFQVGYGPGPDGRFDPHIVRTLEKVGDWLRIHGSAVYGTRAHTPWREGESIRFTQSRDGRWVNVFLKDWPVRPPRRRTFDIHLRTVRARPGTAIRMLGVDEPLCYTQDDRYLVLYMPAWLNDPGRRPGPICVLRIEADPDYRVSPEDLT